MKLLALFAIILSSSAMANSARIGDQASLVGSMSGQQMTLATEVTSYDAGADSYTLRATYTIPGQGTFNQESQITGEEIMTPEKGDLMLVMCSQMGGMIEELSLSMGRFTACKLAVQDALNAGLVEEVDFFTSFMGDDQILKGELWLGKFPIHGIGRMVTPEQSMTLENFRWAK